MALVPWLKLDDAMGEHRKVRRLIKAAGNGPLGLHTLGLLHCSKYLTDGFVESAFIEDQEDLAPRRRAEIRKQISALVKAGMWSEADGGWTIHGYLDHNPSKAKVLEDRAKDAARKAKGRQTPSAGSPSGHQPDSQRSPAVPSRPTPVPSHTDNESSTATQPPRASENVEALRAGS